MTDSEKLDLVLSELQNMKQEIKNVRQELQQEITGVKQEITGVKQELQQEIKGVKQELQQEIREVKQKVTGIELHLENVTDKNIQTIAEGHLDLSRKLDDALKSENEKELLIIRVRMLEDEVRKIKEQLEKTA